MFYSFKNKETGEEFELEMKLCEREPFLEEHPELEQIIKVFPGFVDSVVLGITKPSHAFTDKIKHMQQTIPHNTIKDQSRHWGKNITEI